MGGVAKLKHKWTAAQRRLLTYGSSVEMEWAGEGLVRSVIGEDATQEPGRHAVDVLLSNGSLCVCDDREIDPSTLQPPSIDFIRRLAVERLGADACVTEDRDHMAPFLYLSFGGYCSDGMVYRCEFSNSPTLDRFRAAVAAIVALGNAGLGR